MKRNIRKLRYIIYKETFLNKSDLFWSFLGSVLGLCLLGLIQQYTNLAESDHVFLIGSFGASAILVYGATDSPLAQPRNMIGGHLLSAIVGVSTYKLVGHIPWLATGLSVSVALFLMQITKTLHPPGGATALIAVIGSEKIKALGYLYVLTPVFAGVAILLLVALVVNNIPKNRKYPRATGFKNLLKA